MEEKLDQILKGQERINQDILLIKNQMDMIERILELHRDEHGLAGNTLSSTANGARPGGSPQGHGQNPGGFQGGPEFGGMSQGMGPMGGNGGVGPNVPGQGWDNPAVGPGM
tara:strand:- start:8878 stop:9210 length:333 start_codon:yes stop_codon:yes gene_type:complete